MDASLDQIQLNFNHDSLFLLNMCIAFIMFGVALELKVDHFKALLQTPKPIAVGLISQILLLPALTFLLVIITKPQPSVALGLILVAACPGGNVSNFYSSLAKGNIALSVSLTAIMSIAAVILTPLNFTLWGNAYGPTAELMESVKLNLWGMIRTVILILAVPLSVGMVFNYKYPKTTTKITKTTKRLSIFIFALFVFVALSANFDHFINHILVIAGLVLLHNALGLGSGYLFSAAFKLPEPERRSISIETGIQNTGLALVIIFDFFDGLGGMAFVAAWWGIWHLIAGGFISWIWSNREY